MPDDHENANAAAANGSFAASLRLPPQLDISSGNISENFKKWKRQIDIYIAASGVSEKSNTVKTAVILNCAGPQVLEVYDNSTWDNDEDKNDPDKVLTAIENYCNPRKNEVLESHRFWNTTYQEPFDKFLTELRTRASACNFQEKDRMIRDKIVFSVTGKLQELLLRDDDLDLAKAVKLCRAFEQSNKQAREFRDQSATPKVNAVMYNNKKKTPQTPHSSKTVSRSGYRKPIQSSSHNKKDEEMLQFNCKFCGYKHGKKREKCPAWGKQCDYCRGHNHFKSQCRKINAVAEIRDSDDESDHDENWLMAVNNSTSVNGIKATLVVNDNDVIFQIDSGADINTICQKHVRKTQVTPTKVRLNMWNNTNLKPLGECRLSVLNPRNQENYDITFIVVPNGHTNLLGLSTIKQLGFVTINENRFVSQVEATTLGDLGEATLHIDDSVPPKVLPCRKIPIALQDKVKEELNKLVDRGVLSPVSEPTNWVSQMAIVHKNNGKLRICIDPQPLNVALMRQHYKLPTLEDILPKLSNAKVFSKLDIKEAFWHVRLDEKSSYLTTMITPFGRYRWNRLPFGLKVSSEVFQHRLDETLGNLEGTFCVIDDIIIAGCGNSETEAKKDNEKKLSAVLEKCAEKNIVLNKDKQEVGLTEVRFHGHRITKDGVKIDETKVKAILEMPQPTDISGVKRLCGMVQYMARFLPDLSKKLEPIRLLTCKDTPFNWSSGCEKAFSELKHMLTHSPVLQYFDAKKPVVVQCDASGTGIGACLMQEGKPVEYASRALTPSEQKWAQIEKEALAVLFGLERFDQYTYGRSITIENDHKPLASILKKPLNMAPKRLQDIMIRMHRYDITFCFVKGEHLYLADTLSRAHLSSSENARPRILQVHDFGVPDVRLEEIRNESLQDQTMQTLMDVVLKGWPDHKSEIPHCILPYFDIRDTISVDQGILVKGESVIIPLALRTSIKQKLHSAHLGNDSMLRRARGTVFWPGMASDIKQIADSCEICQEMKPKPSAEPLKQHDDGDYAFQKVGLDLFEISGKQYLITVDYFSNFIEVDLLTKTTSTQVISILKKHFARYGIPQVIISDGGPQFTSQEFKEFVKEWGISHKTSSPMHQRENGKAESAVKIMKTLLLKTFKEKGDPYIAMLEQRNTPRQDTGLSPAQLLFQKPTRTFLPYVHKTKVDSKTKAKRESRKKSVKKAYDKNTRNLSQLEIGQSVYYQHSEGQQWKFGKVTGILGQRTYEVKGHDGGVYKRNRVHMRPTAVNEHIRDKSPMRVNIPIPEIISKPVVHSGVNDNNNRENSGQKDHFVPRSVDEKQTRQPVQNSDSSVKIRTNRDIVQNSDSAIKIRPKREIRTPLKFKDYVTGK